MHDASPRPSGPRLLWISRSIRALALAGAVGVLTFVAAFWSSPAWVQRVALSQWKLPAESLQTDALSRVLAALGSAPGFALALWVLWQVWALFGWYGRGEIFHPRAIHHLRRFGQAVTALGPVMVLSDTLTVLGLTWFNPPGKRQLMVQIGSEHYLHLMVGLVLLAIAQVMLEAQRMAQENAEFV